MTDREKLIADCTLAADLMEQADTFPTGVDILRDAAKALAEAQAAQDAAVAAALERAAGHIVAEAERLAEGMQQADPALAFLKELAAEVLALATQPQSDALAATRTER